MRNRAARSFTLPPAHNKQWMRQPLCCQQCQVSQHRGGANTANSAKSLCRHCGAERTWIHELGLGQHVAARALGQGTQPDERGVAHGARETRGHHTVRKPLPSHRHAITRISTITKAAKNVVGSWNITTMSSTATATMAFKHGQPVADVVVRGRLWSEWVLCTARRQLPTAPTDPTIQTCLLWPGEFVGLVAIAAEVLRKAPHALQWATRSPRPAP